MIDMSNIKGIEGNNTLYYSSGNLFCNDSLNDNFISVEKKYVESIKSKVIDSILNNNDESMNLVLNYLQGRLEEIMDNPEQIINNYNDILHLKKENYLLREDNTKLLIQLNDLERKLNFIEDRLRRLETSNMMPVSSSINLKSNINILNKADFLSNKNDDLKI